MKYNMKGCVKMSDKEFPMMLTANDLQAMGFHRNMVYTRLYCKIYDFAMLGNFIAERRQSRQSRRTYCPRKVFDFAAAFGGIANNFVVCNRGQYIRS